MQGGYRLALGTPNIQTFSAALVFWGTTIFGVLNVITGISPQRARRRTEERRLGQLRTYGLPFFFFSLYILCWWISLSAETPRFGPF